MARTRDTMTISLPPAMLAKIERARRAEDRTRSELVREAIRAYLEKRTRTAPPRRRAAGR
jgi:metal-responsive CopG/Arc/MetJ family transcriptional regulator